MYAEIKGVQASGKMQVLMELLRQCFRRKEKALIFSEFTASLGAPPLLSILRFSCCRALCVTLVDMNVFLHSCAGADTIRFFLARDPMFSSARYILFIEFLQ
jgi:hypothetical protein